jgi:hypothetical protein
MKIECFGDAVIEYLIPPIPDASESDIDRA